MAKKGKGKKAKKVEKPKALGLDLEKRQKLFKYLPLALLFVLTIILFNSFIFSDQMLYGTDTIEAGVMFRSFYASFVREYHSIPQWNPYLFGGMPFVDAMHGDTFYPLAILQFILPIYRALGWKLVLTVFLAGLFMYLCMRAFKFSRSVSLFSGVAYMFSANLVSWVYGGQDGRMYITSLLPLLFFFLQKAWDTRRIIYYLGFGASIGLLILANHPQLAYYALWAVGLYFLFRLVSEFVSRKELRFLERIKPLFKPIALFVLAVLIGLSLSLIQMLPPYIYVNKYSPRAEGGRGYEYAVSWSAHPEELAAQVVPEFCGYNTTEENTYWGRNPFKQNSDYGGIIPLLLAFLCLFFVRDKKVWFFVGLSALAIIYSLGGHTPIYRIFYHFVPQVKNFRAPSLILFLLVFSVVFLAALFCERLLKGIKNSEEQKRLFKILLIVVAVFFGLSLLFSMAGGVLLSIWTGILYSDIAPYKKGVMLENLPNLVKGFWLASFFVGLTVLAIYFLVKKRITPPLFVLWIGVLLIFDLWRVDFKFIKNFDYRSHFRQDRAIEFLQKDKEKFRVISLPRTYSNQDFLAFYKIMQVLGYHGNQLKAYDDFSERKHLEGARTKEEYQQRYAQFLLGNKLDLLNTKYFLSRQPFEHPKFKQVFLGDGVYVFQNLTYLSRARIVFKYEVERDKEKILQRIKDPSFDYTNFIILEEEPEVSLSSTDTSTAKGRAWIEKDEINSFEVKAELSQPGFLILSENYYPSWKAYVDGKETKIYRADYLFRAVYLDKGRHEVKFVFDSAPYKIGKMSTLLTCLVLLLIFGFYLIKGNVSKKVIPNPKSTKQI
ncbi:MAG: YfhO family protein [candidate division Zixibacteria bacterium]|nr:YfhO family protein [candidate division Zixibacteria bacterium]